MRVVALRSVLTAAALLAVAIPGLLRAEESPEASWWLAQIDGQPVGSVATERRQVAGGWDETTTSLVVLNRAGSVVEMETRQRTSERYDGTLVRVELDVRLSERTTRTVVSVDSGSLSISTVVDGESFDRTQELDGSLLGPVGVERRTRELLASKAHETEFQTFLGDLGSVARVHRRRGGKERLLNQGVEVEVWIVDETFDGTALRNRLWVDSHGRTLRSETATPFGALSLVRSDREAAERARSGGELPAESYSRTLAATGVRLPQPRRAESVTLEIVHRSPRLGWPDFENGGKVGQTVLSQTAERTVLRVDRRRPERLASLADPIDERWQPFLRPNAYLQSDAPEARRLAARIVGSEEDVLSAALALERWVAENIGFDLGVVMAPSSEVLDNRRGTCTEYAIALTTLARAAGIPARFVMGYVYAAGMFGGHAWTEVLIGGQWIALDGALVSEGPADAARFAFQWSSLENGVGELGVGPGLQLYGQIDLRPLAYRAPGVELRLDPEAPPYEIAGDRLSLASLGLRWQKPADFRFSTLDAVWPEQTIVSLTGPSGEVATLSRVDVPYWQTAGEVVTERLRAALGDEHERISNRGGVTDRKAAAVWLRPSEAWTLVVEAEGARAWLGSLASTVDLGSPSAGQSR